MRGLVRFINSVSVGVAAARMRWRMSDSDAKLAVYREGEIEETVMVLARGRESWRLYRTMDQFYVTVRPGDRR